jgi:hypothetical protein
MNKISPEIERTMSLAFSVRPSVKDRIVQAAKENHVYTSEFIRNACLEKIERMELEFA